MKHLLPLLALFGVAVTVTIATWFSVRAGSLEFFAIAVFFLFLGLVAGTVWRLRTGKQKNTLTMFFMAGACALLLLACVFFGNVLPFGLLLALAFGTGFCGGFEQPGERYAG